MGLNMVKEELGVIRNNFLMVKQIPQGRPRTWLHDSTRLLGRVWTNTTVQVETGQLLEVFSSPLLLWFSLKINYSSSRHPSFGSSVPMA